MRKKDICDVAINPAYLAGQMAAATAPRPAIKLSNGQTQIPIQFELVRTPTGEIKYPDNTSMIPPQGAFAMCDETGK
jgi:hypothetical protein